jgi:hypothetical protein
MNSFLLILSAIALPPPALGWLPVESSTSIHSDIPRTYHDKGLWQGKGLTQSFSAGLNASWWFFEVQTQLTAWGTQNLASPIFPMDGFSNTTKNFIDRRNGEIDLPYRISDHAIRNLDWSESFVKVHLWRFSLGASMENRWFGPGVRNSIMMGHQAPGFRHLFVKTEQPIPLWIGSIQGTYLSGRLDDTKVNASARNGEWVYLSGFSGTFTPRFFPGLDLGITRTFIINGSDLTSWGDYMPLFQPFDKSKLGAGSDGGGSAPDDQRASIFFSWRLNNGSMRVYGEFAKEDHNANIRDIISEPEHNRAYQVGVETHRPAVGGMFRSGAEITQLTMSNSQKTRSSGYWYLHSKVKQGYTHRGQLLGAAIGPGSSSQTGWSTYETSRGNIGIMIERVSVNRDLFNDIRQIGLKPEIDLTVGLHTTRIIGSLTASAAVDLTHTSNRFFRQGENRWLTSFRTGLRYDL